MGLIREPKDVDFMVKSKPWTNSKLADFRKFMQKLKKKNSTQKPKQRISKKKATLA